MCGLQGSCIDIASRAVLVCAWFWAPELLCGF